MELITKLNNFMTDIEVDYAICGGHAIDLFLGRNTRPHKDLDVAVFWESRDKIIQYLLNEGWEIYEPIGTAYLHKINSVECQKRIKENIWCVRPDNRHYKFTEHENNLYAVDFGNSEQTEFDYIEFLFNTRNEGCFLYSRNKDIAVCLDDAIFKANDTPYLAPEIVLLYKSTAIDNIDYQMDYDNASLKMNDKQLTWLKKSLAVMFPNGHKWL